MKTLSLCLAALGLATLMTLPAQAEMLVTYKTNVYINHAYYTEVAKLVDSDDPSTFSFKLTYDDDPNIMGEGATLKEACEAYLDKLAEAGREPPPVDSVRAKIVRLTSAPDDDGVDWLYMNGATQDNMRFVAIGPLTPGALNVHRRDRVKMDVVYIGEEDYLILEIADLDRDIGE